MRYQVKNDCDQENEFAIPLNVLLTFKMPEWKYHRRGYIKKTIYGNYMFEQEGHAPRGYQIPYPRQPSLYQIEIVQ